MTSSSDKAITWFDNNTAEFKANYHEERIDRGFMKLIRERLPEDPLNILDLGAGTGIVAAHLAANGHHVVAVEPSAAMRAEADAADYILLDDCLPNLGKTKALGRTFDVIIEIAVRMFMNETDRRLGFANAVSLLKPDGLYFTCIKYSPLRDERGAYPLTEAETLALAADNNLSVIYDEPEPDIRGRDANWRGYIFKK